MLSSNRRRGRSSANRSRKVTVVDVFVYVAWFDPGTLYGSTEGRRNHPLTPKVTKSSTQQVLVNRKEKSFKRLPKYFITAAIFL